MALAAAFQQSAQLDQSQFFTALVSAGHPLAADIAETPFAAFVFRGFAHPHERVSFEGLERAEKRVAELSAELVGVTADTVAQHMEANFEKLAAKANDPEAIQRYREKFIGAAAAAEDGAAAAEDGEEPISPSAPLKKGQRYADEVFRRYDANGDGVWSAAEEITCMLVVGHVESAFLACAQKSEEGPTRLTKQTFQQALMMMGFGAVPASYKDMVFARIDHNRDRCINILEFVTASARMGRPIQHLDAAKAFAGYPGLPALQHAPAGLPPGVLPKQQLQDLASQLETLNTGDLILFGLSDPSGRYLAFAGDELWTHTGVVVRHSVVRNGVPNQETENLLSTAPFRRRVHCFCTPSYCRCYDSLDNSNDAIVAFPPSIIPNEQRIEVLEAAGVGVHVFDLPHRLFESELSVRAELVAVRRLSGTGDVDPAQVDEFIRNVRGKLYSTSIAEMQAAMGARAGKESELTSETDNFWCTKLSAAFYQHMGWMAKPGEPNGKECYEYFPGDFAMGPDESPFAARFKDGLELGPIEVLKSPGLEVSFPVTAERKKR